MNSGSEATDTALKLAIQYWHEKGQPGHTPLMRGSKVAVGIRLGHFVFRGMRRGGSFIGILWRRMFPLRIIAMHTV